MLISCIPIKRKNIFAFMNFLRKHSIASVFTFFLALHILNISVDPVDSAYLPLSSRSANEMESITEIIFEKVFDIKNAFPENKHDNNNKGTLLAGHLTLIYHHKPLAVIFPARTSEPLPITHSENFSHQHSCDILTPPPKA